MANRLAFALTAATLLLSGCSSATTPEPVEPHVPDVTGNPPNDTPPPTDNTASLYDAFCSHWQAYEQVDDEIYFADRGELDWYSAPTIDDATSVAALRSYAASVAPLYDEEINHLSAAASDLPDQSSKDDFQAMIADAEYWSGLYHDAIMATDLSCFWYPPGWVDGDPVPCAPYNDGGAAILEAKWNAWWFWDGFVRSECPWVEHPEDFHGD